MFYIFLNRQRRPVLCDSGCTLSCMSYEYFSNNPYLKRFFTPRQSCGTAINGSDVPSIGEVRLKFTLQDTPMSINCKVIKGYVDSASFFRINSMFSAHCALRPNLGCLKEKKSSRTNVRCLMSYTGHDQFIRSDPGSNPFQTKKTNYLSVAPHFALAPPRH